MQSETLKILRLGALLVAFVLVPILPPTIDANQSGNPALAFRIEDLSWISGDWETAPGRMQVDEHWTSVAGGSLIGMSRTLAGGKTVFFEYLRIEARGTDIYYVAHPKARNPGTDFKLVRLTGQEATFENLAHDFPITSLNETMRDLHTLFGCLQVECATHQLPRVVLYHLHNRQSVQYHPR